MRWIFVICCLCVQLSSAQVLNVESLRKVTDTSGWSGAAGLRFTLKRNTNDFVVLGSDLHIQYKTPKSLILLKNDVSLEKISGEDFDNSLVSHLRYNHYVTERVVAEAFIQGQYNKINLIDFRGLTGIGPRFKLSKHEKYKFYLGTLVMYEYEELADGITPIQRNLRGSGYFSFSLYPNEHVTITSTTYYQPRFDQINDYRIYNESSILVGLFSNFGLKTTYFFMYDTFPAVGINESQYNFTTGVTYTFD